MSAENISRSKALFPVCLAPVRIKKGVRYATVAGMAVRGGDKTVIVEHSSDNLLANLDISGSPR